MSNLKRLSLETLAEIDGGRVKIALDQALKRVVDDCDDRPGLKKPRTITLQLAILPVLDHAGICDNVKVQATVTDSIPKRQSKVWDLSLQKGGHLLFKPDSLEDVDQETFEFEDQE